MNGDRVGLLLDSERAHVDKRLRLLGEGPLSGRDELLLASAVRRSHDSRDVLVMSSLAMSTLAIVVAVVVGSMASNDVVAPVLIGYLVLAGILGTATLIAIRQTVTAEVVRVIVGHRFECRREARRAKVTVARSGPEVDNASHSVVVPRVLRRLIRG